MSKIAPLIALKTVHDALIGAVGSICLGVSFDDLLDIFLLQASLLFFHSSVVLLCSLIVIHHTDGDFILHLDELGVHGDCIHVVHDWLA